MANRSRRHLDEPADRIRGCNDNAAAGEACITDAGALLPYPSITPEELQLLGPLIAALAEMAANDLCATTHCSEEPQ